MRKWNKWSSYPRTPPPPQSEKTMGAFTPSGSFVLNVNCCSLKSLEPGGMTLSLWPGPNLCLSQQRSSFPLEWAHPMTLTWLWSHSTAAVINLYLLCSLSEDFRITKLIFKGCLSEQSSNLETFCHFLHAAFILDFSFFICGRRSISLQASKVPSNWKKVLHCSNKWVISVTVTYPSRAARRPNPRKIAGDSSTVC